MRTEIFPKDSRAQGNGFGTTGWAIGAGMTTLVNPIMFGDIRASAVLGMILLSKLTQIRSRVFFLAGLNLVWIPIVFLCKQNSAQTFNITRA